MLSERRLNETDARILKRRNSAKIFGFGVLVAFVMTIPVINLAAPLVATAAMLHLLERIRRTAA